MTSFRNREVLEVITGAPVPTVDEIGLIACCVLDPIDLSRLGPEILTTCELELSKPELLAMRSVL